MDNSKSEEHDDFSSLSFLSLICGVFPLNTKLFILSVCVFLRRWCVYVFEIVPLLLEEVQKRCLRGSGRAKQQLILGEMTADKDIEREVAKL